jgi:hypothetical protein
MKGLADKVDVQALRIAGIIHIVETALISQLIFDYT